MQTINYTCPKCGHKEYELDEIVVGKNRIHRLMSENGMLVTPETKRKIKDLEAKRNQKRKILFSAQDEIDDKKENLISNLENRLKQETKEEVLFRIGWEVV